MPHRDPQEFLDPNKIETLTRNVGRIVSLARSLKIDAGLIVKDDCTLTAPDKLRRRARTTRWHRLWAARELVYTASAELRAAASRLEAEWRRTEESLCGLERTSRHPS